VNKNNMTQSFNEGCEREPNRSSNFCQIFVPGMAWYRPRQVLGRERNKETRFSSGQSAQGRDLRAA
jgi:hypothetical protein